MHQRQVTHAPGTFSRCRGCNREPMHIMCTGRTNREAPAPPGEAATVRHQLECCRCGHVTARHALLSDAKHEWAATFAHRPTVRPVRETLTLKPIASVAR